MNAFVLGALVGMAIAGCGSTGPPSNPSVAEVKGCLIEGGLQVRGGEFKPHPDDDNAPDVGQLVMPNGTFIAFYSSEARANRFAASLRKNAERLGGTTTRHGTITVLYTKGAPGSTGRPDDRVEDCV